MPQKKSIKASLKLVTQIPLQEKELSKYRFHSHGAKNLPMGRLSCTVSMQAGTMRRTCVWLYINAAGTDVSAMGRLG